MAPRSRSATSRSRRAIRNIVWVGTGEANNRQTSTWGDGVYRSLDGGTTWQHMGLHDTQSIGRVVIDPRNPKTVFVAAAGTCSAQRRARAVSHARRRHDVAESARRRREHRSDRCRARPDGRTSSPPRTSAPPRVRVRRRRPGQRIWRSLDGGDSWTRLSNGLPTGNTGRIGLAIAPSNPRIVYAVIENREGGVFRSDDRRHDLVAAEPINERANYYGRIGVDPGIPTASGSRSRHSNCRSTAGRRSPRTRSRCAYIPTTTRSGSIPNIPST